MNILPSISDALDEKKVTSVINKKFNNFVPVFYKFVSECIINAYYNFKDIEMYMVLIYLVNNDFKFYRKNGIQVDYNTFYKDKTLEIEEIKIIEISRDLQIPKESVRRKIIYLEKIGVIKRTRKKIFIDRSAYKTVQPISALKNISYLISISSKILKQENQITNSSSSTEISDGIKKHFSFCFSLRSLCFRTSTFTLCGVSVIWEGFSISTDVLFKLSVLIILYTALFNHY